MQRFFAYWFSLARFTWFNRFVQTLREETEEVRALVMKTIEQIEMQVCQSKMAAGSHHALIFQEGVLVAVIDVVVRTSTWVEVRVITQLELSLTDDAGRLTVSWPYSVHCLPEDEVTRYRMVHLAASETLSVQRLFNWIDQNPYAAVSQQILSQLPPITPTGCVCYMVEVARTFTVTPASTI